MIVNPARHAHVKAREANLFVQWLLSSAGQEAIASFRIEGETLFFPVATPRRGS
jgi:tungstate transport system substrate-binding protein